MRFIDRLTPAMRAIVHEFGAEVVHGMWLDGYRNAEKLRAALEPWRERQQQRWLDEIPYARSRVHAVNTPP